MAFTQVPVRGTIELGDGQPASNAVLTFALNAAITDGTTLISPTVERVVCDNTGSFEIELYANDDSTTQPTGTAYEVSVQGGGLNWAAFKVVVPASGFPAGVELFSLARLPNPVLPAQPYVSQILAGSGISVSPSGGEGVVTVSAGATLPVTLTNVDDDGPTVGAEFTIPAGFLADGAALNGAILATWTAITDQVLDVVVAGGAPQVVMPDNIPASPYPSGPAAFSFVAARDGDTLTLAVAPPRTYGYWGFTTHPLVFAGLDFTGDVTVQFRVTIDGADADNYWHPIAVALTLDPESLQSVLVAGIVQAAIHNLLKPGEVGGISILDTGPNGTLLIVNGTVQGSAVGSQAPGGGNYILYAVGGDFGAGREEWSITPEGYEAFHNPLEGGGHLGVPADDLIGIAQRLQWFDPSSGAPAVRFKEKDETGVVYTGISLGSTGSQATVGAAGVAAALPATPATYIKVTDEAGNHYVIPAYAVS